MNKTLLAVALSAFAASGALAQPSPPALFSAPDASAKAAPALAEYRQRVVDPSVAWIKPIGVDASLLARGVPALTLNVGDAAWTSERKRSYRLDDDSVVWSGTLDLPGASRAIDGELAGNQALFVVTGGRVFGQINIEGETYEVETSESGRQYFLVRRDFAKLPDGDDTPWRVGIDAARAMADEGPTDKAPTSIRVIQGATPQAVNALGGRNRARDRMRFFVSQANNVYDNNNLPITLVQAGLFFPGQNQPTNDGVVLIDRLSDTNDGYADGLASSTRNDRDADLVGLITGPGLTSPFGGLCGIADAIAATPSSAFFLVEQSCTNFTFVHEIGHLFGARHDNDPTTTPFAYGHGFVNGGANFRTVMAVSSNPQPRIGFFSTDDQTRNGASLGNASFRDNERVHNVRRDDLAGFR